MSRYSVLITEKAISDMMDITRYISNDLLEPSSADRFLEKFQVTIAGLSTMPKRHELVNDDWLAQRHIRKIFVDNYIIFYTVDDSEFIVYVIRVLYGKRDWINLI